VKNIRFHRKNAHFPEEETLSFDSIWNLDASSILAAGRTSDVSLVNLPLTGHQADNAVACRKRYWYPGLNGKLKGFFRNTFLGRSRACSEFINLRLLVEKGLSRVAPLAYGEERFARLLSRAFILTEFIPGTVSLFDFIKSTRFKSMNPAQRRSFLCSMGRWVFALHTRGYRDKDLFSRNILIHENGEKWLFSKIDSSAGRGGKSAPGTGAPFVRDLADLDGDLRLFLSRVDRLRCIHAYMGSANPGTEAKHLVRNMLSRASYASG